MSRIDSRGPLFILILDDYEVIGRFIGYDDAINYWFESIKK